MMNWDRLLSGTRLYFSRESKQFEWRTQTAGDQRSEFYRDGDRVLFSSAFRRLHDKTQVYPMPENDLVHSRLTHSVEVASIGRTIARHVGKEIVREHESDIPEAGRKTFSADIGDVVYAACLAHDIGNPPFGHSGETAIGEYFQSLFSSNRLLASQLSDREKQDFLNFDGNVQGFRLLTRLQDDDDEGLGLTAATIAAFCKYPREAGDDIRNNRNYAVAAKEPQRIDPGNESKIEDIAAKKHGCSQEDREQLRLIASAVGLIERKFPGKQKSTKQGANDQPLCFSRHPLVFLVEAADNISYLILDLEDGIRLNYANEDVSFGLLRDLAKVANDDPRAKSLVYLRGRAIAQLRQEVCGKYIENYRKIMDGDFFDELSLVIESRKQLEAIEKHTITNCYNHRYVDEIALAGGRVLRELLEELIPAFIADQRAMTNRHTMLLRMIGKNSVNAASIYARILRAMDYVAGMTDGFASSLYRRLSGIDMSSSIR